jgi:hypothetical protein
MAVSKTTSTNGKWFTYAGTYAEVVDALDAEGIPEHKVKGIAFVSAGNCVVIVHKH